MLSLLRVAVEVARAAAAAMSSSLSPTKPIFVGALILGGFLALLLSTEDVGLGAQEDGSNAWPYLMEDWYDRLAYQQRGRWIASGGTPYLQEFSEYPQLSTWLMGAPYLFFDHGVKEGEPFQSSEAAHALLADAGLSPRSAESVFDELCKRVSDSSAGDSAYLVRMASRLALEGDLDESHVREVLGSAAREQAREREELLRNRRPYGDWHHGLMGLFYFGLLVLTTANLRRMGRSPWWALLLLLPASLFFGFNRFDMVVTFLVGATLFAHLRGRRRLTALLIGLAIMTKWYPVVLVPLLLSHDFHSTRLAMIGRGEPAALGRVFLDAVLFPGLIVVAVIVTVLGICWAWDGGGLEAVKFVFDWHANVRKPNHSSLLHALTHPDRWGWLQASARPQLELLFKALQLAPGFVLACFVIRTRRALLLGCLAATLGSMVFSEFFSPQWVIWVTALAVLLAPTQRRFLALLVGLELVMYLQLPLFHHHSQAVSEFSGFWFVNSLRIAVVVLFFVVTLFSFFQEQRRA
ncbi:MAG: hypothetical protein ACI9EF_003812 [Pseudohongiellaceae bacterium]